MMRKPELLAPAGGREQLEAAVLYGADAVYKLYRAGITQGSTGNVYMPESPIRRCEVAAILTRMMNEEERMHFSL